jgi:hypothetical protein
MKRIIYTAIFVGGLFVGMFKGQDVRQRWVAKMKNRHEENKSVPQQSDEVNLDEIELATYHS